MAIDPKLKGTVLSNLRSVTQSVKGGVPFDRLERDYRDLVGTPIPYRDLGYDNLQSFVYSIPDVITLQRNSTGQLVAVGKADESTAHIVSLVSRQKTENKKPQKSKKPYRFGYTAYRPPVFRSNTRENARPSYSRSFNTFSTYSRYSASNRNQSKSPPPQQPRQSILPTPQHRSTVPPTSRPRSPTSPPPASYSQQTNFPSASRNRTTAPAPRPHVPRYEIAPRFLNRIMREVTQPVIEPTYTEPSFSFQTSTNEPINHAPAPQSPVKKIQSAATVVRKTEQEQPVYFEQPDPQPNPDTEPRKYVKYYAKKKNISLKYKTLSHGQKKKHYISSLHLGDKSYSSYGELDIFTAEEAELIAAKMAVADIKIKESTELFPVTLIGSEESKQVFADRIVEIVCEKPTGMFSNGVLREYEIRFNETLPDDWLDLVRFNTDLEVEVPYGTKLPKGSYILRRARDSSSGYTTPSSTSSKTEAMGTQLDATTLRNSIANMNVLKVPSITLPLGNQWGVFITLVESTMAIYCRLVNYAEDFAEMSEKMKDFYATRRYTIRDPVVNQLYAASFDDEELWHRVLIKSIGEDGQVLCHLVDEGDTQEVNVSNLQELEIQFQNLPYQALQLKLFDLEDYEKVVKLQHLEEYILAQSLIAEVLRRDDDAYSVILYDTSKDNDINLNDCLRERTILESLNWELPEIGTSSIAYLTHVTENGDIYLRFSCPHKSILEAEMEKLLPKFEEIVESISFAPPPKTKCAAKYVDDSWYRAIVLGYSDPTNSTANVLFIDYGNTELVSITRICDLEQINMFLASVPYQAVKCGLHKAVPPNSEWTWEAANKLTELCPVEDELIIKVETKGDSANLPKVNLLKRNKDSYIISINETLALEPQLFRESIGLNAASISHNMNLPLKSLEMQLSQCNTSSPTEMKSLSKSIPDVVQSADEQIARRLNEFGPSGDNAINWDETPDISSPLEFNDQLNSALSYPEIPEAEKYFDVVVTVAANPLNFVVQPYKSGGELEKLMKSMNNFYSDEENHVPMHFSLLKENCFYAALHKDGAWYRVRISKVYQTDTITAVVHFVDYGDFGNVTMSNLQNLWKQFKSLPCQAIKASLAGVRPNGLDWDPMQCISFQELVAQKPFVSIVKRKLNTHDLDFPITVQLMLIDTSSDADICINDLLVERKIARRC